MEEFVSGLILTLVVGGIAIAVEISMDENGKEVKYIDTD
jgi:hypothetical protein